MHIYSLIFTSQPCLQKESLERCAPFQRKDKLMKWKAMKKRLKSPHPSSLHQKACSLCVLNTRLTSDLSSDCHPSVRISAARLSPHDATNQRSLLIYWLLSAHGSQPAQTRCALAARLHRFFSSHLKLREQNRPGLELDQAGAQFARRDHHLSLHSSLLLYLSFCLSQSHFFLVSVTEFRKV